MEVGAVQKIPADNEWSYEPKWDGFRCLAFRDGHHTVLQSKSGQPLARYFPEVVEALAALPPARFVLDGKIVLFFAGRLDFDARLQRIHPAASRIRRLVAETPATYLVLELLVDAAGAHTTEPLARRRQRLEAFFAPLPTEGLVRLSPATRDREIAERWMRELGAGGLDGVIAKRVDAGYRSGERTAMQKVKRLRTADRDAPGGPSRWSTERWQPLKPTLVCEVRYDHVSDGRFRHGTKFLRWRPDKAPSPCTCAQIEPPGAAPALASVTGDAR